LNLAIFIFILPFLILTNAVPAAEIRKSASDECVIEIVGSIKKGDYKTFKALAKEILPGDDGESSSRDIVCLNSPGGKLSEGVLFSQHFLNEGVSTIIRANEECYSACAIMFMMGNFKGSEVAGVSRKMHVSAKLGFHRPFLQINSDETINVKALAFAYDDAFSSALDMISLANTKSPWSWEPMMKPDLVQEMLSHTGNDFFLIDNIDKAGRWGITIFGYILFATTDYEKAFYSCENTLQWKSGQTKRNVALEFLLIESFSSMIRASVGVDGKPGFKITGLDAGLVGEGCFIQTTDRYLIGCGVDENTDVSFGSRNCSSSTPRSYLRPLSALSTIYPWTTLKELDLRSTAKKRTVRPAICLLVSKNEIIDSEVCFAGFRPDSTFTKPVLVFRWASGVNTILEAGTRGFRINGDIVKREYEKGFDACYKSTKTDILFCYNKAKSGQN